MIDFPKHGRKGLIHYKAKIKSEFRNLLVTGILALLFAFFMVTFKGLLVEIKSIHWILDKRNDAISCSTNDAADYTNWLIEQDHPANKNNGNGCPHQLNASVAFSNNDIKRKKNHGC
jgi:hypothetical protein